MKHFYTTLLLLYGSILSLQAQRFQIPYYDDFENGAPGWFASDDGQGTAWELGTPAFGLTTGAHSGMKCWDVNLVSGYQNNALCYLYSPVFDFTYVASGRVSFWLNYRVEYLWDYVTVEYTVDNGDSWTFLPFPELISPDGITNKWVKSAHLVDMLYGYPEVQFRFTFISDGTVAYDGYSIDDFKIDSEPLSVASNHAALFNIYPNPSNGTFSVTLNASPGTQSALVITDLSGRVIESRLGSLSQMENISGLSNGIYFLGIHCNNQFHYEKIVVQGK